MPGKGLEGSAAHPADRNVSVKACSGLNIHMLSRGDSHDSVVVETMSASLAPHSHGETAKALIHLSAATRPLAAKALQESAPATAKLLRQPAESLKKKGRQLVVDARSVWLFVLICTRLYAIAAPATGPAPAGPAPATGVVIMRWEALPCAL